MLTLVQTSYLQDALAVCGWKDAAKLEQQDTSEAFGFITEKLELPLLTLKMDIYHTGTEDDKDDHKFIHERLLEVAVPPESDNGRPIQLEDCLENFFNNRVEVVRRLERSNTLSSVRSNSSTKKSGTQHVEVIEMANEPPISPKDPEPPLTPLAPLTPVTPATPGIGRTRTGSLIRHRLVQENGPAEPSADDNATNTHNSMRKGSIRKEVLMPAWQFFNLIRPSPFNLHVQPYISCITPESPYTNW